MFILLVLLLYLGFFALVEDAVFRLNEITGQAISDEIPHDCSYSSIEDLWYEIFNEMPMVTIMTQTAADEDRCNSFAAYYVNNNQLYFLRGTDILENQIYNKTTVVGIFANVTNEYAAIVQGWEDLSDVPVINKDAYKIINKQYLFRRNITKPEAKNSFEKIFNVDAGVLDILADATYGALYKNTDEISENITDIKVILANLTLVSYYYEQTSTNPQKSAPVISANITPIIVNKGTIKKINLQNFISDQDTPIGDLKINFSGMDDVIIAANSLEASIVPDPITWYGTDNIILTVTDSDGLSDIQAITVKVMDVNGPPVIYSVEPDDDVVMIIGENVRFSYSATDPDSDTMESYWQLDNGTKTKAANYSFTATSLGDKRLKLIVTDGKLNTSYRWEITVVKQNNAPVLSKNIPDQRMNMNTSLKGVFDLDSYFSDPDNDSLTYLYEGNNKVTIKINMSNNRVSLFPVRNWYGTEVVRFIANDGDFIKKSNNVTISVNYTVARLLVQNCTEKWDCSTWLPKLCPENGTQKRTCVDRKSCGTVLKKPAEISLCTYNIEESNIKVSQQVSDQYADSESDAVGVGGEVQLGPVQRIFKSKTLLSIIGVFILTGLLGFVGFEKSRSEKKLNTERNAGQIENSSLLRLTDYIRRELQQGFSSEQIRTKLLYEGWNEYIVNKAFSQLTYIVNRPVQGIESIVNKKIHDRMQIFEDKK
ncbi:MAG: hypothetical protein ABIC04_06830 [Nanoarchaeota archaeon]